MNHDCSLCKNWIYNIVIVLPPQPSPMSPSALASRADSQYREDGSRGQGENSWWSWCAPPGALALALGSDTNKENDKKHKVKIPNIKTIFEKDSSFQQNPKINIRRLVAMTSTEKTCISFLQNCLILPTAAECPTCGVRLLYSHTHKTTNCHYARCSKTTCSRVNIGIKTSTILRGSRIPMETFLMMMYQFLKGAKYSEGEHTYMFKVLTFIHCSAS